MAEVQIELNGVVQELLEIKSLLQTLIIIEGARTRLTRDQVRKLTGVATKRVSDIWGSIREKDEKKTLITNG